MSNPYAEYNGGSPPSNSTPSAETKKKKKKKKKKEKKREECSQTVQQDVDETVSLEEALSPKKKKRKKSKADKNETTHRELVGISLDDFYLTNDNRDGEKQNSKPATFPNESSNMDPIVGANENENMNIDEDLEMHGVRKKKKHQRVKFEDKNVNFVGVPLPVGDGKTIEEMFQCLNPDTEEDTVDAGPSTSHKKKKKKKHKDESLTSATDPGDQLSLKDDSADCKEKKKRKKEKTRRSDDENDGTCSDSKQQSDGSEKAGESAVHSEGSRVSGTGDRDPLEIGESKSKKRKRKKRKRSVDSADDVRKVSGADLSESAACDLDLEQTNESHEEQSVADQSPVIQKKRKKKRNNSDDGINSPKLDEDTPSVSDNVHNQEINQTDVTDVNETCDDAKTKKKKKKKKKKHGDEAIDLQLAQDFDDTNYTSKIDKNVNNDLPPNEPETVEAPMSKATKKRKLTHGDGDDKVQNISKKLCVDDQDLGAGGDMSFQFYLRKYRKQNTQRSHDVDSCRDVELPGTVELNAKMDTSTNINSEKSVVVSHSLVESEKIEIRNRSVKSHISILSPKKNTKLQKGTLQYYLQKYKKQDSERTRDTPPVNETVGTSSDSSVIVNHSVVESEKNRLNAGSAIPPVDQMAKSGTTSQQVTNSEDEGSEFLIQSGSDDLRADRVNQEESAQLGHNLREQVAIETTDCQSNVSIEMHDDGMLSRDEDEISSQSNESSAKITENERGNAADNVNSCETASPGSQNNAQVVVAAEQEADEKSDSGVDSVDNNNSIGQDDNTAQDVTAGAPQESNDDLTDLTGDKAESRSERLQMHSSAAEDENVESGEESPASVENKSQNADSQSRNKNGKAQHECEICQKKFLRKFNLTQHLKVHTYAYKCDICDTPFISEPSLIEHEQVHIKEYKCPICERSFKGRDLWVNHMLSKHGENKQYCCKYCGKWFVRKDQFLKHQTSHPGLKPYECSVCGESFERKDLLLKHRKLHSVKQFECETCQKVFLRKDDLGKHLVIHGDKPYQCNICEESFSFKHHLIRHENVHREVKKFKCLLCEKSFKRKDSLKNHESTEHKRNGLYSCKYCKELFQRKRELLKHQTSHPGVEPYKCKECAKSFKTKLLLDKHKQVHSKSSTVDVQKSVNSPEGKSTFRCDSCDETFSAYHEFAAHVLRDKTAHHVLREKSKKCYCCKKRNVTHGKCDECSKRGNNSIPKVDKISQSQTHKCLYCGHLCKTSNGLKTHVLRKHGFRYLCEWCEETFVYQNEFLSHQKCHPMAKPFKCTLCSESFRESSQLTTHVNTHNVANDDHSAVEAQQSVGKINIDAAQLVRKKQAEQELDISQTAVIQNHECLCCEHSCRTSRALRKHMLSNHGFGYQCEHCGETFTHKKEFISHQKIHPMAKPFKCSLCTESFVTKWLSDLHRRTHIVAKKNHSPVKVQKSVDEINIHLTQPETDIVQSASEGEDAETVDGLSVEVSESGGETASVKSGERDESSLHIYQCEQCPESFPKQKELKRHRKMHVITADEIGNGDPPDAVSDASNNESSQEEPLEEGEQIAAAQSGDEGVEMQVQDTDQNNTDRNSSRSSDRENKTNSEKEPDKLCSCEFCPETFARRKHLKRHRKMHESAESENVPHSVNEVTQDQGEHLAVFQPSVAGEKEQTEVDSTMAPTDDSGMQGEDTEHERKYVCEQCNESFDRRKELKKHRKTHENNDNSSSKTSDAIKEQDEVQSQGEQTEVEEPRHVYNCKLCAKSFSKKKELKKHKKLHKITEEADVAVDASTKFDEILGDEESKELQVNKRKAVKRYGTLTKSGETDLGTWMQISGEAQSNSRDGVAGKSAKEQHTDAECSGVEEEGESNQSVAEEKETGKTPSKTVQGIVTHNERKKGSRVFGKTAARLLEKETSFSDFPSEDEASQQQLSELIDSLTDHDSALVDDVHNDRLEQAEETVAEAPENEGEKLEDRDRDEGEDMSDEDMIPDTQISPAKTVTRNRRRITVIPDSEPDFEIFAGLRTGGTEHVDETLMEDSVAIPESNTDAVDADENAVVPDSEIDEGKTDETLVGSLDQTQSVDIVVNRLSSEISAKLRSSEKLMGYEETLIVDSTLNSSALSGKARLTPGDELTDSFMHGPSTRSRTRKTERPKETGREIHVGIDDVGTKSVNGKSRLKTPSQKHSVEKGHQCGSCQKHFSSESTLSVHKWLKHSKLSEVDKFKCTTCSDTFTSKYKLDVHSCKNKKKGSGMQADNLEVRNSSTVDNSIGKVQVDDVNSQSNTNGDVEPNVTAPSTIEPHTTLNASDGDESVQNAADGDESAQNAADGDESAQNAADGDESAQNAADGDESAQNAADGDGSAQNAADGDESAQNAADGDESAQNAADGDESAQNAADGDESAQNAADGDESAQNAADGDESAQNAADGDESAQNATMFDCNMCNKSFKHKHILERHRKTHSGQKSHHCVLCNDAFYLEKELAKHEESHLQSTSHTFPRVCTVNLRKCDDILSTVKLSQAVSVSTSEKSAKKREIKNKTKLTSKFDKCRDREDELREPLTTHKNTRQNKHTKSNDKPSFPCENCGATFAQRKTLIEHECAFVPPVFQTNYTCKECNKKFLYKAKLKQHELIHSTNRPTYNCDKCEKKYTREYRLTKHLKTHMNTNQCVCAQCDEVFNRKEELNRHEEFHNPGTSEAVDDVGVPEEGSSAENTFNDRWESLGKIAKELQKRKGTSFNCDPCKESFDNKISFEAHMKKKHYTFECPRCEQIFSQRHYLASHKLTRCSGKAPNMHTCDRCCERFSHISDLIQHKCRSSQTLANKDTFTQHKLIHLKDKPSYPCENCGETFSIKETLTEHKCPFVQSAVRTDYRCKECNMTFLHKAKLKRHELIHSTNRPTYKCDECEKEFSREDHIRRHKCIHVLKGYVCKECNETFSKKLFLDQHMLIHATNRSMFQCDKCEKEFTREDEFKRHKCKAREICKVCKITFPTKWKLNRHMLIHSTNGRIYQCNKCEKKYSRGDTLKNHHCKAVAGQDVGSVAKGNSHDTDKDEKSIETVSDSQTKSDMKTRESDKVTEAVVSEERDEKEHMWSPSNIKEEEDAEELPDIIWDTPDAKTNNAQTPIEENSTDRRAPKSKSKFQCGMCGIKLSGKLRLARHEKSGSCVKKVKSAASNASLDQKKVFNSGDDKVVQEQKVLKSSDGRNVVEVHTCNVCDKSFGHISSLMKHMKVHYDSNVQACTRCNRIFANGDLWKSHMNIEHQD